MAESVLFTKYGQICFVLSSQPAVWIAAAERPTGYEPFQTTDYGPFKTTGYEPFETTGCEPFQTTGYGPFETPGLVTSCLW